MPHILIIEDDARFRGMIAAALVQNGHTVSEAEDGRAGLALLKARPVDLILTDVLMPEKDGIEVIMKLRETKSPIPVIAMSGHPAEADMYLKVSKSLGARRILQKPFRIEELLAAIREVLAGPARE